MKTPDDHAGYPKIDTRGTCNGSARVISSPLLCLVAAMLCLGLFRGFGQYTIDWWAAGGGSGASAGGAYTVSGTAGQSETGPASGGQFGIESGFWSAIAEVPPLLSITFTNGFMTVSWPVSVSGFVLDQTSALGGAPIPWTVVPPPYASNETQRYIRVPVPAGNRFYRLHKP